LIFAYGLWRDLKQKKSIISVALEIKHFTKKEMLGVISHQNCDLHTF